MGDASKLLGNVQVVRNSAQNDPEVLDVFQAITEITPVEATETE